MPSYCESNTHWILVKAKIFTTEYRQLFQSCTGFAVGKRREGKKLNLVLDLPKLLCIHSQEWSCITRNWGEGVCLQWFFLSLQRMFHMNDSFILYSSHLSFPKPFETLFYYSFILTPSFLCYSPTISTEINKLPFPAVMCVCVCVCVCSPKH